MSEPSSRSLQLLPRPRGLEDLGRGAAAEASVRMRRDPALPAEGFELTIDADGVRIAHADRNGRRYAEACLAQIRRQCGATLPGLRIRDWPDFPVRGYMLDVSRDRVPTRETLSRIVELLDLLRLNHLQLYTEHTFAYRDHAEVWRDASPITPDDVRWLDALCRERGIELAANQNCFGHMGRWLRHASYRGRAEAPDGWTPPGGGRLPPGTLAPTEDNARFALELVRELMTHFSSRRINIGCDETFELGEGVSRAAVERAGRERVYLDHLLRLVEPLLAEDREVLFWGDILRSAPELVGELPRRDLIALAWHYEGPLDPDSYPQALRERLARFGFSEDALRGFAGHVAPFADRDFPFWVCPGTSSWNSLVGRLPNARANLLDAAQVGLAHGAQGYLVTDWGDNGHLQPPAVSFPPLAYGAALAWCLESNRDLELAPLLDAFVFDDAAGEIGSLLETIGAVGDGTGQRGFNASPLHKALLEGGLLGTFGETDEAGTRRVIETLDDALRRVLRARAGCVDGALVVRELGAAIRLARHGAWRLLRASGLPAPSDDALRRDLGQAIEEQRACWLARARPGGLIDSLARLERTLESYDG
jgi:hypothetical protein